MLTFSDGYVLVRYEAATNTIHVTELSRHIETPTKRTSYSLPEFLQAITPEPSEND